MKKEKVFIVLSHKHHLKQATRKGTKPEWEVAEKVEFVSQLREKHYTTSSAIGDYINCKMVSGNRFGFMDYAKFDEYIRKKYSTQMAELDAAYLPDQVVLAEPVVEDSAEVFSDDFGNIRAKTVFDTAS
jgi:hypothetical protein